MKIDAVRGIDTHVRTTPNRLGEYPVVCAELCGLGHAAMRQTAHVVTPGRFDQWLQGQARKAQPGGGAQAGGGAAAAPDGKAIFTGDGGCKNCHTLADAGATATIGPNLDKVLPALSRAEIQESVVTPDAKITPGYSSGVMPGTFAETLGEPGVKAVVDYLVEVSRR
jgi:cytochrome c oxidase subunit 2